MLQQNQGEGHTRMMNIVGLDWIENQSGGGQWPSDDLFIHNGYDCNMVIIIIVIIIMIIGHHHHHHHRLFEQAK